jgi:hypothetical protein
MKNFLGIFGLIIGILSFSMWFYIAKESWNPDLPNNGVPIYAIRIFYSGYFISASMFLYALSLNSNTKIRQLIWYGGSNFYAFLMIGYFLNWNLDILIGLNKIIFTLILTVSSCIIFYLLSVRSRSDK